jgi:hypothetical protein
LKVNYQLKKKIGGSLDLIFESIYCDGIFFMECVHEVMSVEYLAFNLVALALQHAVEPAGRLYTVLYHYITV